MELIGIKDWGLGIEDKLIISGPCSAETETQVVNTCQDLAKNSKVNMLRAGIWKPRTRPNSFEGIGAPGLDWLVKARELTDLPIATEVATPEHIELCLKAGVDVLWIGARTTVNPFAVQAIADRLRGVDIPVMVKNPINPDVQLWRGAIERLYDSGVKKIAAIHRGFSSYQKTAYRNEPKWELAIELKTLIKDIEIVCDPSHICGNRELLPMISQKALDLAMDGLMIESHENPDIALSDSAQQLKPSALSDLIDNLHFRHEDIENDQLIDKLADLRAEIDHMDNEILETLSKRMKVAEQIGQFKKDNEVTVLQVNRWEQILEDRLKMCGALGLSNDFIKNLLNLIHKESISKQRRILED